MVTSYLLLLLAAVLMLMLTSVRGSLWQRLLVTRDGGSWSLPAPAMLMISLPVTLALERVMLERLPWSPLLLFAC